MRTCPTCEREFKPPKPTSVCCSRPCAQVYAARQPRPSGRGVQEGGYAKRGQEHEHRQIAEEKLGRPLEVGEVVHHVNGNSRDNSWENLEVLPSQAAHVRLHARKCPPDCTCGRHTNWRTKRQRKEVMP